MRDREVNNKTYVRLLEEREQARIREAAEIGNIRVIQLAKVPGAPTRPRKMLNLVVGLLGGIAIGLMLIFAREFMRDAPKTPEEIEQLLNVPVLASVPRVKQRTKPIDSEVVAPMMGDAFSYLWSSVELALARGASVLMVTSARAAEGKSTVAANLCLLAAQQGKNTILIDGDIRHPTIHKRQRKRSARLGRQCAKRTCRNRALELGRTRLLAPDFAPTPIGKQAKNPDRRGRIHRAAPALGRADHRANHLDFKAGCGPCGD
jgi:hypothetical protein